MKYLVTFNDGKEPFLTKWFDYENNFIEGMIIFDLNKGIYTIDGINWKFIEEHL